MKRTLIANSALRINDFDLDKANAKRKKPLTISSAQREHESALEVGNVLRIWFNGRYQCFVRRSDKWEPISLEKALKDNLYTVTVNNNYTRKTRAVDAEAARDYAVSVYRDLTGDTKQVTTSVQRL